jgi:hypothetical protein
LDCHGSDSELALMVSLEIVTPVKTGVQFFCSMLKSLDSWIPVFTGMTIRQVLGERFKALSK